MANHMLHTGLQVVIAIDHVRSRVPMRPYVTTPYRLPPAVQDLGAFDDIGEDCHTPLTHLKPVIIAVSLTMGSSRPCKTSTERSALSPTRGLHSSVSSLLGAEVQTLSTQCQTFFSSWSDGHTSEV
ncbi:hypothetical protein DOTSEDRAFT_30206 [Dothistroma septosporum NZE10]|uniref:Uncharacterized protein n=1 Tax=Dothistroma septosporum (strain NZE10 / CBS 128990) TaxID=675120 RepID=N1Q0M5_DOTSN|nr:hypothetical protein DOTSEDRAFT_30206 [Dothistroma septosporum NZE10]